MSKIKDQALIEQDRKNERLEKERIRVLKEELAEGSLTREQMIAHEEELEMLEDDNELN